MILYSRDKFRELVFKRDNGKCVVCGEAAKDAHHIIERRLWKDGGYYLENGASLCGSCHLKAESTEIGCDFLREKCGIEKIILPEHLYPDQSYDKWGNIVYEDGSISPGELFYDSSVEKIMSTRQTPVSVKRYNKYPRTYHLPWSEGATKDDRIMSSYEPDFEVVITEKMDGENTTLYSDHIHARSINSKGHESRNWVKNKWSSIKDSIPLEMRICGENLFAKHAIHYDDLPSYFMVFSIWVNDVCLDWYQTVEWAALLDLHTVPVLHIGKLDHPAKMSIDKLVKIDTSKQEGYVVRPVSSFSINRFQDYVGKYVRKGHVQASEHWLRKSLTKNRLRNEN